MDALIGYYGVTDITFFAQTAQQLNMLVTCNKIVAIKNNLLASYSSSPKKRTTMQP